MHGGCTEYSGSIGDACFLSRLQPAFYLRASPLPASALIAMVPARHRNPTQAAPCQQLALRAAAETWVQGVCSAPLRPAKPAAEAGRARAWPGLARPAESADCATGTWPPLPHQHACDDTTVAPRWLRRQFGCCLQPVPSCGLVYLQRWTGRSSKDDGRPLLQRRFVVLP